MVTLRREVPLSDVQHAWDEAQVFLGDDALRELPLVINHGMRPRLLLGFTDNFASHVRAAAAAMGFMSPRPAVPGLNECENGILVIEEAFCRHVEAVYGPCGAAAADKIRDGGRAPAADAEPLGLLVLENPAPRWINVLADILCGDHSPDTVSPLPPAEPEPFLHISWSRWLLLSADDLIARGVPRGKVEQLRVEKVGQPRNMQWKNAFSVGMWGQVRTEHEIASLTGQSLAAVRAYKKKNIPGKRAKLRTSDIDGVKRRVQLELAYEVGFRHRNEDPHEVCRVLGILPAEHRLYQDFWMQIWQRLRITTTINSEALLELAAATMTAGHLRVGLPPEHWGRQKPPSAEALTVVDARFAAASSQDPADDTEDAAETVAEAEVPVEPEAEAKAETEADDDVENKAGTEAEAKPQPAMQCSRCRKEFSKLYTGEFCAKCTFILKKEVAASPPSSSSS